MTAEFGGVLQEVEFLVAERRTLMAAGPSFKIISQNDEIAAVVFVHRTAEIPLKLSITALRIFDYLARHRFLLQSATQIEAGLHHKVGRRLIKQYVRRLRQSFEDAFAAAELRLDPYAVLISEQTDVNQILYRLHARIEWEYQ